MKAAYYIAYLLSEPRKISCVKASEVLAVFHDEINCFFMNNQFSGKDLFEAVKQGVLPEERCCFGGRLRAGQTFTNFATT